VGAHAGSAGLQLLADRTGLSAALTAALRGARLCRSMTGARCLPMWSSCSLMVVRRSPTSTCCATNLRCWDRWPRRPTVWRTLNELTPARLARVETARARVRRRVWSPLPGGLPASKVADTDLGAVVVLDVDAIIVVAHSEKESAAPTFKGSFGFHPIGVWCDNTAELLAAALRPGNAGANTTADHLEVLTAAIAQIPPAHRGHLLIRADGAGASH
jgi:hypothetical protein